MGETTRTAAASRRGFLQQVAAATGAAACSAVLPSRVLGANERVRIGLIGAGDRGTEIFRAALHCPNTEAVAVADVYTHRLDAIKRVAPGVKTYSDFRHLLDDHTIDAVLIATPQHQHALNFVPALQAGKDVYQEKTMAFNPDHARRMRRAFEGTNRVVQIGIQSTSGPGCAEARRLATPERMGTITLVHAHHYRNAPYGGWLRHIPGDCDPRHVNWPAFQGEAKPHPFDPNRVINWRFYWDYSGGNVFENMVHQVGFWFKVLDLNVPRQVTMSGANFLSPKMEPPDTMDVSMRLDHLLFTWNSAFGNHHYGETSDVVGGTRGSLVRNRDGAIRYLPEKRGAAGGQAAGTRDGDLTHLHMQNFFDCVRSRKQPNCPFELGYRSAIACQMAVASYRHGRTVRWDAGQGEIV